MSRSDGEHHDGAATGPGGERDAIRRVYDAMADDYLASHAEELEHNPFDREVVDDALAPAVDGARVADLGCGPGHVATYLARRGLVPIGFDLSPAMLRVARTAHTPLPVVGAELLRLPLRDGGCGGAVARFVVHHVVRPALPTTLAEVRRVLAPGAPFLIVAQGGVGERDHDGGPDRVTVTLYGADELSAALESAAFGVRWVRQRDPRDEEYPATKLAVAATAV